MCSHVLHGWVFWSIQGTEPLKREPKAKSAKAETKKPAPKKGGTKKSKANTKQKATRAKPTDVPSYGCGACGATFGSQKAAIAHALTHTT